MARANTGGQRAIQQSGQDLTIAMDSVFKKKEPDADVFFTRDIVLRYGVSDGHSRKMVQRQREKGLIEEAGYFLRNNRMVMGYRVKGKS